MDIRKLQRAIVDGLEDVKAQDILVFNTEHLSPLFERVIIASGTSNRQTKALASGVREAVKAAGFPVLATEGGDNGEWIIVDCGAAVAHIMQPAIREYYRLEEIWGGKVVKMKLGGVVKGLVKASEPDEDDDAPVMAPERKAAARKGVVAKPGPARKAVAQKQPVVAKKAPAKKAPDRKTAGQPVVRTTNAERAAAAAAKIAAAQAAAAAAAKSSRKAAAGKLASGKTAAGKPAAPSSTRPAAKVQTIVVKPPARKSVDGAKPVAGRAPARKTGAPGRTAAGTAGPARKTAARKTASRKTTAPKAPTRKPSGRG